MTPRSIRRAAERKARKAAERKAKNLALRAEESLPRTTEAEVEAEADALPDTFDFTHQLHSTVLSQAKLAANRANAQLSTGPTSNEGRRKASLNAVKTALTGRTVLLPSDDAALYEEHVLAYTKELRPLTQRECDLVQSIADTAWRLKRIPALEMAIFAQGRVEFADSFDNYEPSARPSMIELRTFLAYEKQLRNLQLQEARLHRRYEKDTAELRKIQAERDQRDHRDLDTCSKLYLTAKHDGKPFHPSDFGFEFSMQDIEDYLVGVRAAKIAKATLNSAGVQPKQHRQAA